MIEKLILELVDYGMKNGLVCEDDRVYTINRLMELFELSDFDESENMTKNEEGSADGEGSETGRPLHLILEDMMAYAFQEGIMKEDTITMKDLFDTKIMGLLTPPPSVVRARFKELYEEDPKKATEYYYAFSQATNYIRKDRIVKDEKWSTETEYGTIDMSINLSKPEKDPRDIAKAGAAKKSGYPACLLCKENEGYAGRFNHPARQNHRIVPFRLSGQDYFLQYSPYVYYNEHCIIFNAEHTPMKIDRACFEKLLSFVQLFPHYTAGSNADLPIVGGSILSHDHFQGGGYTFAMAKAPYESYFNIEGFEDITSGIVKWPMSVIRLQGTDLQRMTDCADMILRKWREYTDEAAFIYAETDGVPHNTITPIARMRGDLLELDLVLRNNITTSDSPWGVYHPSQDLHHIKKENIGLIEVMGLSILPARLKKEMQILEDAILSGKDIRSIEEIEKHADWAEEWLSRREVTAENIHSVVQDEMSRVFVKVLECAGVYKRTEEGMKAFVRFTDSL